MTKPVVYLITPGEATEANFAETSREILASVRRAVDNGVSLVQIREKNISARSLVELSSEAAMITAGTHTKLLVNDRADIALAACAAGVHLTSRSLPPEVLRKSFPADLTIGVSTHTPKETVKAAASGADFALFGPVFLTPGKAAPAGLAVLAEVCKQAGSFPVIAIGGIDGSNCGSVVAAGAAGVAAIRSLNDPDTLKEICRKLGT